MKSNFWITLVLLTLILCQASEGIEYSAQYNKEKETTHELVGYTLVNDMITPIYIYWGSEDYGNRICAAQGDSHLYLQEIPLLLNTKKVEEFFNSFKLEEADEKSDEEDNSWFGSPSNMHVPR